MSTCPGRKRGKPLIPQWRPTASIETIHLRSHLLAKIRSFFEEQGVIEVETPVCSAATVTDPAIDSLITRFTGPGAAQGRTLYLHTSPEFAMKRLLAAGSGPIYQICKVFRDGEAGRFHNPEFTLLEWYRPNYGLHQLMDEMAELIRFLLGADISCQRLSYRELFLHHLGFDPHEASLQWLRSYAVEVGLAGAEQIRLRNVDAWLDLLLTHCIEPKMEVGMVMVYDYPASQASLARIRPGTPQLAERFELYINGIELANGFHELADAEEQRKRFRLDLEKRGLEARFEPPLDEHFLAALEAGLPDCSGVALGIDRLLMCLMGANHIDQVLTFPIDRA